MQHVTRTPGVCGGWPCVAGTRVRVWDVFQSYEEHGQDVTQVSEDYPHLTPADIHAALAYFYDHEAELREQLRQKEEADEAYAEAHPEVFRLRRLLEAKGVEIPR